MHTSLLMYSQVTSPIVYNLDTKVGFGSLKSTVYQYSFGVKFDKTQVYAFYLQNRNARIKLIVYRNGVDLENCDRPDYFGVYFYCSLTNKTLCEQPKIKVGTINDATRKLVSRKRRAASHTLWTATLAL